MHSSVYYVLYYLLAATCFGTVAIVTEFTSVMLKRTAIKYFYNIHAYQMCRFLLTFTAFWQCMQWTVWKCVMLSSHERVWALWEHSVWRRVLDMCVCSVFHADRPMWQPTYFTWRANFSMDHHCRHNPDLYRISLKRTICKKICYAA
jgi:hypothetical protein